MNQIKPSLKQIKVLKGYCVWFFFSSIRMSLLIHQFLLTRGGYIELNKMHFSIQNFLIFKDMSCGKPRDLDSASAGRKGFQR